jgi:hypothetical protein
MMSEWKSFEEVGTYLLDQFAAEFGLDRVEGKQDLPGQRSGTSWAIDAKGVRHGNEGFVIVEFRRYTTSRQTQGKIGHLAYTIIDTGAQGGIIVSPLGLQTGAEKIAATENIVNVILNENCDRYEYIMQFLNKVMIGVRESINTFEEAVEIEVKDKDGIVVAVSGSSPNA